MIWESGFSATYKVYRVDPVTWEDRDEIPVIDGSITRDIEDSIADTASLTVTEPIGETWVRVYLIAEQDGGSVRVPLFTGLTSSPTRTLTGERVTYSVDCYGRLKLAADKLVPLGYYVAAGARGAETIADLLGMVGIRAEVSVASSVVMDYIIAESGETILTMSQKIASAIGWQIRVDGRGDVSIMPPSDEIRATFSNDHDVLELSVTDTDDWYECPNVLRVTSGSQAVTVYDDDPASPLSVQARGREIWAEESVQIADKSELPVYARNRLQEKQRHVRVVSYTRRFDPDVFPGDLVGVSYPQAGLTGVIRVKNQTISLTYGARTDEEAYFEA